MIKSIKNTKAALLVVVSLMIAATASAQQAEIETPADDIYTSFGSYWVQATAGIRDNDSDDTFQPTLTGNIPIYKGETFGVDLRGSFAYWNFESDIPGQGTYTTQTGAFTHTNPFWRSQYNNAVRNNTHAMPNGTFSDETFFLSLYVIPSWKIVTDENFSMTGFVSAGLDFLFNTRERSEWTVGNAGRKFTGGAGAGSRTYYTGDSLAKNTTSEDDTTVAADFRVGAEFVFYKFVQVTPYFGYAAGNNSYSTPIIGSDFGVRLGYGVSLVANVEHLFDEDFEATSFTAGVRYTF